VAVIGAVAGLVVWRDQDPSPVRLRVTSTLHAYEVRYRITFEPGHVVNEEHRLVERPFHSISVSSSGDGRIVAGTATTDDGLFTFDASRSSWLLLSEGRQRATADPQPAAALQYALDHDLADILTQQAEVLGRPCTLVRTGAPLGEPLKAPTDSEHVDVCLDASGVMLRYEWTLGGSLTQQIVATSFDPAPTIAADSFSLSPRPLPNQPAASVVSKSDTELKSFPTLRPPSGFSLRTAYVLVDNGHKQDATTVGLFAHGEADLVTVRFGSRATTHQDRSDVTLAGGYTGQLDVELDSTTLTVDVGLSITVVFIGTDPDLLLALAAGLQPP
jgi:hypothetical protein